MKTFLEAVDVFLQKNPSEDAVSAKRALMCLYALMSALSEHTKRPESWFKVQQLQSWTPLRLFWETLVTDDSLPIRAAAKGNICEASGIYWNDSEVGQMSAMNLETMRKSLNSNDPTKLQRELAEHPRLREAEELWVIAGFGRFTPQLVVRDLSVEDDAAD